MNDVECSFSTELDGPFTVLEGIVPESCVLGDVVVDMAVVASVGCDIVGGGVVVGSDVAVVVAAFVVDVVVVVGDGVVFTVSAGDSTPTQKNA